MSIVPGRARTGTRGILAPVGRALHRAGVSANAVTVVGFLLTLAGATVLALGNPRASLAILLAGALADTLDGQVAKAAGGGTRLGAFLDSTFDRFSDAAFAVAAVWLGVTSGSGLLFWSGVVALVAGSLVPYIRAKAESLGLTASVGLAPREARLALLVLGVAAWAVTTDLQLFAAAVVAVALLASITSIQRIVHVARSLNT